MTTLSDRQNSGLYSGLANNAVFAVVMISVGLTVFESLRRVRGHTTRPDIRGTDVGGPLGSIETWELGYLYQARSWSIRPPKPIPKWPLVWVKDALLYPESKLQEHTGGLDGVVYVRFLAAAWFFALLHLLTTVPILLPIHLIFNPTLPWDSLNRASLQYLSTSDSFLWVHLVMIYWVCFTWLGTLIWFTRGALRYRRRALSRTYEAVLKSHNGYEQNEQRGWRFRSIMVENIPSYMRNEQALKDYFEKYLAKSTLRSAYLRRGWWGWWGIVKNRFQSLDDSPDDEDAQEKADRPRVVKIVLAHKASELQALCSQREVILRKLETLHVKLAQSVLNATTWRMEEKNLLPAFGSSHPQKNTGHDSKRPVVTSPSSLDVLVEKLGPTLKALLGESKTWTEFPPPLLEQTCIWKLLYDLPPELLHPYQPLVRLKPRYAGRLDVAIDYYALKLAAISKRIDEERLIDDSRRSPASTAFVTFEEPRHARRAIQYLAFHPRAPDTCFVSAAPDPSDINWKKVMQSSFRGAFLRDFAVTVGVWFFTIIWVIPVTGIVGLFSITNISSLFPALQNYFAANPAKESLISSFLPTLLVSILVILMPTLFALIYSHVNTILTASKLNDMVLSRYWKFLVCNTVFFFSLGVSSIASFVNVFQQPLALLPVIAREFSAAAPFYVGWFVFQTGMHFGLAISLTGLPVWLYPLVRNASTLRRRAEAKRPRNYDYSYWLPTQLLVMLIVHVFAILNPLVIPFCFIYLSFENVVLKHQFVYVFSRAFETNGYRINIRVLRYSCDGLIFAQAIFLVLMILLDKIPHAVLTGLLIIWTIFAKLYLSRRCKAGYAAADEAEAELICSRRPFEETISSDRPPKSVRSFAVHFPGPGSSHWADRLSRFWKSFPFEVDLSSDGLYQQEKETALHALVRPTQAPADANPGSGTAPSPQVHSSQPYDFSITQGQFAPSTARPVQHQPAAEKAAETGEMLENGDDATMTGNEEGTLLKQHAPTSLWDDAPRFDGVYDNPFYSRPLDEFMWLPRNPLTSLDLDDSVDVYFALLSRPEEGWQGVGRMPKEVEARVLGDGLQDQHRTSDSVDMAPSSRSLARQPLLGTRPPGSADATGDAVELPPIIAARVEHIEQEKDVEEVESSAVGDMLHRPSILNRRSSSTTKPTISSRTLQTPSGARTTRQTSAVANEDEDEDRQRTLQVPDTPETADRSRRLSSFQALAQQVLAETRQERMERDRKQKNPDTDQYTQTEQLASLLDSHGVPH